MCLEDNYCTTFVRPFWEPADRGTIKGRKVNMIMMMKGLRKQNIHQKSTIILYLYANIKDQICNYIIIKNYA